MDSALVGRLAVEMVPVFAMLVLSSVPLGIIFMTKHFKLRTRELELEAALHSQTIESQLRTLEGRLAANEAAVTSVVNVLSAQRSSLFEAPGTSAEAHPGQLAREKVR